MPINFHEPIDIAKLRRYPVVAIVHNVFATFDVFWTCQTRFSSSPNHLCPNPALCSSSNMSSFELIRVEAPSQPLLAPNAYKNVKFARITEQDASGKKKAPLNGRSVASDIPLNKLMVSAEQAAHDAQGDVSSPCHFHS
jgi:hypothetical protein